MITQANTRIHSVRFLARFEDANGEKIKRCKGVATKEVETKRFGALLEGVIEEADKLKKGVREDLSDLKNGINRLRNAPKEETIPARYLDKSGFKILAKIKEAKDAKARREAVEAALGNGIFPNTTLDFGDLERVHFGGIFDKGAFEQEGFEKGVEKYSLEYLKSNTLVQSPNSRVSLVKAEDLLRTMFGETGNGFESITSTSRYVAANAKVKNDGNMSAAIFEMVAIVISI
jgi:hypothetical protein